MSSTNSTEAQSDSDALHVALNEINVLKSALAEKQNQLVAMETACLRESDRQVELEDSVIAWQDKYDRLYESHKRVQRVNQNLEDKLLKLVDRNASERAQLTSDVATMSVRLAQANFNIAKLQREIERYKADINLAIQLLQCKPDNFMQQKVSSLPIDIQSKVSSYVRLESNSHSDSEASTNGVGVSTTASYKVLPASDSPPPAPCPFPPTAMVYSMRGLDAGKNADNANGNDNANPINANNNSNKSHGNESNQSANNNNNNNNVKNNTKLNSNNNITNSSSSISNSSSSLLLNNNGAVGQGASNALDATSMISPIVIAKFLEDELKADKVKHCDTCNCATQDLTVLATDMTRLYTVATQTHFHPIGTQDGSGNGATNEPQSQLCLRCHSNLNSPSRANSPYLMKLVKSSDSVISETKSSVSDLNDIDKLFTPSKKDDLMVNPILGHHRLCDRTTTSAANISAAVNSTTPTTTSGCGNKSSLPNVPSSMMYPNPHLGAYAGEKYLLETNSMAAQNCSNPLRISIPNGGTLAGGIGSYKRRFLDGGGTALDLLDKYEKQKHKPSDNCDNNNELDDEARPLLSTNSHAANLQSGLRDHSARNAAVDCAVEMAEVACEELNASVDAHTDTREDTGLAKACLKKSTVNSSMSSLWSKTSSGDGVKIFENFNRNLIKTIKAENPKHRGPRLCAMRIQQNGQSNILLDNIESIEAVTPVIYKRRERLLDEELDDTKDVITSKTTAMAHQIVTHNTITPTVTTTLINGMMSSLKTDENTTDATAPTAVLPEGIGSSILPDTEDSVVCNGNHALEEHSSCHVFSSNENSTAATKRNDYADVIGTCHNPTPPVKSPFDTTPNNMSCSKVSLHSKSCTQSSSISDAIDFQETALLRRQQLSRVAEWVQNNRQQLEEQQHQKLIDAGSAQHSGVTEATVSTDERQSSTFSTLEQELDSVSVEKLSTDSGYKTTPQGPPNGGNAAVPCSRELNGNSKNSCSPKDDSSMSNNNNNNSNGSGQLSSQQMLKTLYRRTIRSGHLPAPCAYSNGAINNTSNNTANTLTNITNNTVTDLDNGYNTTGYISHVDSNSSSTTTNGDGGGSAPLIIPEQPTCDILNYKYYPSENDKTHAIHAELHTTTQNVDIAQMEYNVKQFLLKQNEWSMRCSSSSGTSIGGTVNRTDASNGNYRLNSSATIYAGNQYAGNGNVYRMHSGGSRILRQVKIFSNGAGGGFGPGVGARIHATSTSAATTATTTTRSTGTKALEHPMPQRTETNL